MTKQIEANRAGFEALPYSFTVPMTKELQDEVKNAVYAFEDAVKAYILASPDFPDAIKLASECGRAMGNLESILHHKCGVWDLALPNRGRLE